MTRVRRRLWWLVVALLCVQLYAITQHYHDLTAHPDDCTACSLAAMSCGSAPPAGSTLVVLAIIVAFWFAARSDYVVNTSCRYHLRPPSQAPPRV